MSLETALIEVRQNLCCANVFLNFNQVVCRENSELLKIIIKSNEIVIKTNGGKCEKTILNLDKFFSLETHSISCLVVRGKSASFRLQLTDATKNTEFIVNRVETMQRHSLKLNVSVDDNCHFRCSNCENSICERSFARILELPSGFLDISDWFCHKSDNFQSNLAPNTSDLFYGLYYILLNSENLIGHKTKENYIYCRRCLKFLGQLVFDGLTAKLWNDNLLLHNKNQKFQIFEIDSYRKCLYEIIEKTLYECNLTPEIHFIQFAKILFSTIQPNRRKSFLMLNVMEKNLQIIMSNRSEQSSMLLNKTECFKVMYKVENGIEQPLLNYWKNDINVHNIELSCKMFLELVSVLANNSIFVPEMYRQSNGFTLSYFSIVNL